MIKTGIIGGAGYTGGELIRLLLNHPDVELTFVNSKSHAGKQLAEVHEGLFGETDMCFTDELPLEDIDLLFFCTAHGQTREFMNSNELPAKLKVIDFSQDYRIKDEGNEFIYGLPELNRRAICSAQYVANPGCFATCIQLALLPLAKMQLLKSEVHITGITGSTGAGQAPQPTTHFSWRCNNLSIYKPYTHQHLAEIRQSLKQLQNGFDSDISFIPMRGDFARGIFAAIETHCELPIDELYQIYNEYYSDHSFTFVTEHNPDMKEVINTNKCLVHLEKYDDKLLIVSTIDNLLKGASGQAVHNMNLLFGLEEKVGLHLKASAF